MKKSIYILVFIAFGANAQNLVPNPSFEIFNSCENDSLFAGIYWGRFPPWNSPTDGSPDGFNSCDTLYYNDVPYNDWGFQYPHSGNGYIGACCYDGPGEREYSQIQLSSPLVANVTYCAGFFISLGRSKIACNNIGMYFSDTSIYLSTLNELSLIPQINDTNIIDDTLNWTLISGQYIAHGGEEYIIIGNFYPNALTDTTHPYAGANIAYYYFDDVSVMRCDASVGEIAGENEINLYPNPAIDKITIQSAKHKIQNIEMFNVLGELVLTNTNNNHKIEIDISTLPKSIYFIQVQSEKGVLNKKIVIE